MEEDEREVLPQELAAWLFAIAAVLSLGIAMMEWSAHGPLVKEYLALTFLVGAVAWRLGQ